MAPYMTNICVCSLPEYGCVLSVAMLVCLR